METLNTRLDLLDHNFFQQHHWQPLLHLQTSDTLHEYDIEWLPAPYFWHQTIYYLYPIVHIDPHMHPKEDLHYDLFHKLLRYIRKYHWHA